MNLISIYARPDRAKVLYELLAERRPSESISHQGMPTFDEHVRFVEGRPYESWYFVEVDNRVVGAVYLSRQSEIGIFIFGRDRGNGYGKWAIGAVMARHGKRRYLANIAPRNMKSAEMFAGLGFKLVQHTYANG